MVESEQKCKWTPRSGLRKSVTKFVRNRLRFRKKSQIEGKITSADLTEISLTTGMELKQVEKQYARFLTSHPSGRMGSRSLQALLQESLPGSQVAGLAKHILRMYDTNGDGGVDFRELMVAIGVMSKGSPEENLNMIFRLFDINSNGRVEREELVTVAKELAKLGSLGEATAYQAFEEMDEDRDGSVTQEEFVVACLHQRRASTCLALRVIDIFVAS